MSGHVSMMATSGFNLWRLCAGRRRILLLCLFFSQPEAEQRCPGGGSVPRFLDPLCLAPDHISITSGKVHLRPECYASFSRASDGGGDEALVSVDVNGVP